MAKMPREAEPAPAAARRRRRKRRDLVGIAATVLCALFALVGLLPVAVGFVARTPAVEQWAARETARILREELKVEARYAVDVQPWPLAVALEGVVVDSDDGGAPLLRVEQATVRPRIFSLLAGKLDVGRVELIGPVVRAIVKNGELVNFRPHVPERETESEGDSGEAELPFEALAITDGRVDVVIDDLRATAHAIDVDLTNEGGGVLEVALRASGGTVTRRRAVPGRAWEDALDEDVVCRIEARVRKDERGVLVRRLHLAGVTDVDPDPGTRPECEQPEDDSRLFSVRLGGVRVTPPAKDVLLPALSGRVTARIPVGLVHRALSLAHTTGFAEIDLDIEDLGDPLGATPRLPSTTGTFRAVGAGIDGKVFGERIEGEVSTLGGRVDLRKVRARWADGDFELDEIALEPFAPGVTLQVKRIRVAGVEMTGILRDMGVHPSAHVGWTIDRASFDRFGGTLSPIDLQGLVTARSHDFGIYDRPWRSEVKRRMFGVARGDIRGNFTVEKRGVHLRDMHVDLGKSKVLASVLIGFANDFALDVKKGTSIDLSEISPLVTVPIEGTMEVTATGRGDFSAPIIDGELSIDRLVLGGFRAGRVEHAKAHFVPLKVELSEVVIRPPPTPAPLAPAALASSAPPPAPPTSLVTSPRMLLDFESGADILVDADLDTRREAGVRLKDFLRVFKFVEDLPEGTKRASDPLFEGIDGWAKGVAHVRYALGGREDRCGTGSLKVRTTMHVDGPRLMGEAFESGDVDVDFAWDDTDAGAAGMDVQVNSASLRDAAGSVLIEAGVRRGGALRGNVVVSGMPLGAIEALGAGADRLDGNLSIVGELGGNVAAPAGRFDVSLSPLRVGRATLPPSRLELVMEPAAAPPTELTRCKNPRGRAFDWTTYEADRSAGIFRVAGQLFGGQIRFDDLAVTQQRSPVVRGIVVATDLDVGALLGLVPQLAFATAPPKGRASALIEVRRLPLRAPQLADASLVLRKIDMEWNDTRLVLEQETNRLWLVDDELTVPDVRFSVRGSSGARVDVTVGGEIERLTTAPVLGVDLRIDPVRLERLAAEVEGIDRVGGELGARLSVRGPIAKPRYSGAASLRDGSVRFTGTTLGLDQVAVDVVVDGGEVRIVRGTGQIGGGTVAVTGRMPLEGLGFGTATASITAKQVRLPLADGIDVTADADLEATYRPPAMGSGPPSLPEVRGTVSIVSFRYTRPITMSLDLSNLTGKAKRTEVEAYDPSGDAVRFEIDVVSPRPLAFQNNLIDMRVEVVEPGITVAGTNQRFGARGSLRVLPESKLQLRNHQFDVREGTVRFDDLERLEPQVDLRAETEFRRYAAAGSEDATDTSTSGGATSGQWDITLRARGEIDALKLELSSDPPLSQDDILLLLTVGMTRAEVDRSLATSLGETVGLEALSQLTGADRAVKSAVPIIDYFHFGSSYSSTTGRTEPNVTVGKRLSEDVRASVTTTLTERDVTTTLEWRLSKIMSVLGSYDNSTTEASSLGNIGADLRWRLEFE